MKQSKPAKPLKQSKSGTRTQQREISKLGTLRLNLIPDMDEKLNWLFDGVSINECDSNLLDELVVFLMRHSESRKTFLARHPEFRESLVTNLLGENTNPTTE